MIEVVRLYWELVGYAKRGGSLSAVQALHRPAVVDELAQARVHLRHGASADHQTDLRIAVLVVLPPPARLGAVTEQLARLSEALAEIDVGLDLWLQLPPEATPSATRFLNTTTAATFLEHTRSFARALEAAGVPRSVGLCLDMEPDEALLEAAWHLAKPLAAPRSSVASVVRSGRGLLRARAARQAGQSALDEMHVLLKETGRARHVAVLPPLVPGVSAERTLATRGSLLGCPARSSSGEPLFGQHAAMAYSTLARRALGGPGRRRERDQLLRWVRQHREVVDELDPHQTPALALGQIGCGLWGTEPVYDHPHDLADDVDVALEHGFYDLSFFCLEGLLFGPAGLPDDDEFRPTRVDRPGWWRALVADRVSP